MTRKKKPEAKKPAKGEQPKAEKPASDLTSAEAIERLFPRGVIDAARERLEPRPRPGFEDAQ